MKQHAQQNAENRQAQSIFCQQFGKANSIAMSVPPPNFIIQEHSTIAPRKSVGVAKVLQSEKNAVEILDAMDI